MIARRILRRNLSRDALTQNCFIHVFAREKFNISSKALIQRHPGTAETAGELEAEPA